MAFLRGYIFVAKNIMNGPYLESYSGGTSMNKNAVTIIVTVAFVVIAILFYNLYAINRNLDGIRKELVRDNDAKYRRGIHYTELD